MTAASAPVPHEPDHRATVRRRCRWSSLGCAVLGLVLLAPLLTLDGPGSWRTAWLLGLPALVGLVGVGLAVLGRRVRLVVANVVCGLLSVPLLLVVATLVLGP